MRKVAGSIPDEASGVFNWPSPSSRTMARGSTQPLAEMSTRNLPEGNGRTARKADNGHLWAEYQENDGASTLHNPMGLHGLLQRQLYLYLYKEKKNRQNEEENIY
jgi:hypothetical protein